MNLSREFPIPSKDPFLLEDPRARLEYPGVPGVTRTGRTKLKFGVDQILSGMQETLPCDLRDEYIFKKKYFAEKTAYLLGFFLHIQKINHNDIIVLVLNVHLCCKQ